MYITKQMLYFNDANVSMLVNDIIGFILESNLYIADLQDVLAKTLLTPTFTLSNVHSDSEPLYECILPGLIIEDKSIPTSTPSYYAALIKEEQVESLVKRTKQYINRPNLVSELKDNIRQMICEEFKLKLPKADPPMSHEHAAIVIDLAKYMVYDGVPLDGSQEELLKLIARAYPVLADLVTGIFKEHNGEVK